MKVEVNGEVFWEEDSLILVNTTSNSEDCGDQLQRKRQKGIMVDGKIDEYEWTTEVRWRIWK